MNYQASETILGVGTHRAGMDASTLLNAHRGVGLLLGADGETGLDAGDAVTVRTHLLHMKAVPAASQRGRALREAAGTLTGDAADRSATCRTKKPAIEQATQSASRVTRSSADSRDVELPEALALVLDVIEDHENGGHC